MYHGYTLIDAQIREYCDDSCMTSWVHILILQLRTPPLFRDKVQNNDDPVNIFVKTGGGKVRISLLYRVQKICQKKRFMPVITYGGCRGVDGSGNDPCLFRRRYSLGSTVWCPVC